MDEPFPWSTNADLRLRVAGPGSFSRAPGHDACGSRAVGLHSGEADLVHRFQLLAAVVREDHFEGALALRAEREGEKRVVAQRRGERELADPLAGVLDLHLLEVERFRLEIDLPLADGPAPPVRVPDLDLRVQDLAPAQPTILHQLGDADGGRVDFVGCGTSHRRIGPAAAASALAEGGEGGADRPRAVARPPAPPRRGRCKAPPRPPWPR